MDAHESLHQLNYFRELIAAQFPIFEWMPAAWVSQLMNGLEMNIFDQVFRYFESVPDTRDASDFPDMLDDTGAGPIQQASQVPPRGRELSTRCLK